MRPTLCVVGGLNIWLRRGKGEPSSDEQAAREVLEKKSYRRIRPFKFDVLPGEHWLDLGANIGAFAMYVRARGAIATCFEPDIECFQLLERNLRGSEFRCFPHAVTTQPDGQIQFMKSSNPQNHYRGTEFKVQGYEEHEPVLNTYAGVLVSQRFDGVKMDIEGSEGPIIDQWLLPRCNKLVMEYHTSRDSDVNHLASRLAILKKHFRQVYYPNAYDKAIAAAPTAPNYRPQFDQLIFCLEPRL